MGRAMVRRTVRYGAAGTQLVRKLAESGERIFSARRAQKLATRAGLAAGYSRQALHHLSRSGWIVRLRKGLYTLGASVPGAPPLHEFEIAMALVKPAAISHWSALNYHGLTEQTPRQVFVMTTSRAVPRLRRRKPVRIPRGYPVGDIEYRFVQIKPSRYFGIEEVWVNETRVKITDPERTLLDGLMTPRYFGDFAEVLHSFRVRRPKLEVDRIVDYALKLDAATVKRLGWVLERLEVKPSRLKRLLEAPIKGFRTLDPSGPRTGSCDSRWMIQMNLPRNLKP
jgi:predicted transcriptional regulator of viral defense system